MSDERETIEDLAAAVALLLWDAHPFYGSTAGRSGGIGGQAITQFCSMIHPEPGQDWTQLDMLSRPLREYMIAHPEFDLEAAKERVKDRAMKELGL